MALAMNAPMQLSSSNSLISLSMTSSPGKTTTGEQELWFRDGMRTAGFYCPDEGATTGAPSSLDWGSPGSRGHKGPRRSPGMPPARLAFCRSASMFAAMFAAMLRSLPAGLKREAEEDWGR